MPNTIADNLQRLVDAKNDIADAITTMGGTVNEGDGFEEFPTDIATIPAGGGSEIDRTITTLWTYGIDNTKSFAKQYGNTIAITITATSRVRVSITDTDASITIYAARISGLDLPSSLNSAIISASVSNISGTVGTYGSSSTSRNYKGVDGVVNYIDSHTLEIGMIVNGKYSTYEHATFGGIATITVVIQLPE